MVEGGLVQWTPLKIEEARVRMNQTVSITVDWTLNPSKLLVGHRFASGAYSQLYRGFYDEKPVVIKFIC
jgi:hypothetical protein